MSFVSRTRRWVHNYRRSRELHNKHVLEQFGKIEQQLSLQTQALTTLQKNVEQLGEELARLRPISEELRGHRRNLEALRMSATSAVLDDVSTVLSTVEADACETLKYLVESDTSFARFGDGELRLMLRPEFNLGFQPNSEALRDRLLTVLTEPQDGLLVGLPQLFRDAHWSGVWSELWTDVRSHIDMSTRYGNAHVTRPTFFKRFGTDAAKMWSAVWSDKSVAVIAGEGSRFIPVPELFSSARSITTIEAPARDAFDNIDEITSRALATSADIFLIALGPTATILAYELSRNGRRALDVGHISASYENVMSKAVRPESR